MRSAFRGTCLLLLQPVQDHDRLDDPLRIECVVVHGTGPSRRRSLSGLHVSDSNGQGRPLPEKDPAEPIPRCSRETDTRASQLRRFNHRQPQHAAEVAFVEGGDFAAALQRGGGDDQLVVADHRAQQRHTERCRCKSRAPLPVAIDGHFQSPHRRCRAAADLGHSPQDRRIEVPRSASVADSDGYVFKNDETPFVPQGFPVYAALPDRPVAVLASEIIHGSHPIRSRKR